MGPLYYKNIKYNKIIFPIRTLELLTPLISQVTNYNFKYEDNTTDLSIQTDFITDFDIFIDYNEDIRLLINIPPEIKSLVQYLNRLCINNTGDNLSEIPVFGTYLLCKLTPTVKLRHYWNNAIDGTLLKNFDEIKQSKKVKIVINFGVQIYADIPINFKIIPNIDVLEYVPADLDINQYTEFNEKYDVLFFDDIKKKAKNITLCI